MPECLKSDTTKRKPTFCQSFVRAQKTGPDFTTKPGILKNKRCMYVSMYVCREITCKGTS